jgi:hypothetical protein
MGTVTNSAEQCSLEGKGQKHQEGTWL